MKIMSKIALTVIPTLLILIIAINIAFGLFFNSYMLEQEDSQIASAKENISSFLNEKITKYSGAVNDWAHWDDTYNFIANNNTKYITANLNESSFTYLDLSFVIVADENGTILFKQFFDNSNLAFSDFPSSFVYEFDDTIEFSKLSEDTSGIIELGGAYYFIAASDVTDSMESTNANGKIIFGRQLDSGIIEAMEKISNCTITSISTLYIDDQTQLGGNSVYISNVYYDFSKDMDLMNIELAVPNKYDQQYSVKMSLNFSRSLYLSGMKDLLDFSLINIAACTVISIIVFFLLGKHLTKPFNKLIQDVKAIDLSKNDCIDIAEKEQCEFKFLRKSINNLLARIEADKKSLAESSEKLHATLLSVGDGVVTTDNSGKIQFMNPVAQKLTGWGLEDAMGLPIEDVFTIINEYTRQHVESPIKAVFETDKIIEMTNHILLVSKDKTEIPIESTSAPIKDLNGEIMGCVLVFRDFSEQKEKQKYIEYLSLHDQLTGLYNRRFFDEEFRRLDVEKNMPLSIIYADINGLKIINDAFGHEYGDTVIRQVADVFKKECRPEDIIARIGGDEFIILLSKTDANSVEKLVDKMKIEIAKLNVMGISLSVSFGWDTKYEKEQAYSNIMKSAEDYMYNKKILDNASKRNGIIKSILNILLLKSPREEAHSTRVSKLCAHIGHAYGLDEDNIKELRTAGELHDIGKIAVDKTILNRSEGLSELEWAQMKHHPEIGYRLLGATIEFNNIAEYVLAHHERWDDAGYPKGLKGDAINWNARVIAIADAYDAMTCQRPYRNALCEEDTAREIKSNAGTQFDPDIARVFIEKVLGFDWDAL